ncbi:iron ABC transporter permease [Actinopolymorpha sp. NPDC004070]|uniref:FecCD family ABC transporter permease n=1 Tax=Actinopolymorpha sp. NPDC004070 TaxID=3154548 RepID=UPI0033AA8739
MTQVLATSRPRPRVSGRGALAAAVGISAVAAGVFAASVLVGSSGLSWAAVLDPAHPLHAVYQARLERTVLAFAVGAALGVAGACMQGLTRNPLADPGILGVNAGASFAMVLAISYLGLSQVHQYLWFAFGGAAAAAVVVHVVASLGRDGAGPLKLAVAGAAVTAAVSSWTSGVLLVDRKTMESFRLWQVGTVGGRGFDVLAAGLPFLVAGLVLAFAGIRMLDTLVLGSDLARGLGRRVWLDKLVLGLAIVLLAGTATALAGPIAFVGLIVPHAVRAVTGPRHARVVPLSAVGGALLVGLADTVGRVVLPPTEVQVGIMTAVVGVPVFVVLLRRGRMGGL